MSTAPWPGTLIVAHNYYRSGLPSGENTVVGRELALWRGSGQEVIELRRDSDALLRSGPLTRLWTAWRLTGSASRRCDFICELKKYRNPIVHLHNPWPLITYDLALACREAGVPIVQTLHNYRLIATNDRLVDHGRLRAPRDAHERLHLDRMVAMHGRLGEFAYRRVLSHLWRRNIPQQAVDRYICLTRFQQRLVIAAGIPAGRTTVVGNFLDVKRITAAPAPRDHALFVGRLDGPKGIDWLMRHWPATGLPLHVVGDGPLAHVCVGIPGVTMLGRQTPERVLELMAGARLLVMASRWYETFGLTIIEAAAVGTPALVPDLGAMAEIVQATGMGGTYAPDDPASLVASAQRLWDQAMPDRRPSAPDGPFGPHRHGQALAEAYRAASGS